jgi:hypothetical protein
MPLKSTLAFDKWARGVPTYIGTPRDNFRTYFGISVECGQIGRNFAIWEKIVQDILNKDLNIKLLYCVESAKSLPRELLWTNQGATLRYFLNVLVALFAIHFFQSKKIWFVKWPPPKLNNCVSRRCTQDIRIIQAAMLH